jgi:hypothetical protein
MANAKARRILALLSDPRKREKMLQAMNGENLDDVGPVGGTEQGMKILSEMNSLVDYHGRYVNSLVPRLNAR